VERESRGEILPAGELIGALRNATALSYWQRDQPLGPLSEAWWTGLHLLLRAAEGVDGSSSMTGEALLMCRLLMQSPFAADQELALAGYRVIYGRQLERIGLGLREAQDQQPMLIAHLPPGVDFLYDAWRGLYRSAVEENHRLYEQYRGEQSQESWLSRLRGPGSWYPVARERNAYVKGLQERMEEEIWPGAETPDLLGFLSEMAMVQVLMNRRTLEEPPEQWRGKLPVLTEERPLRPGFEVRAVPTSADREREEESKRVDWSTERWEVAPLRGWYPRVPVR